MNPHVESRFYLDCLDRILKANGNVDIAYNTKDEYFARNVASEIAGIINELDGFYGCGMRAGISIFVYPDADSMSKAFGRKINDQWCFVPEKGEHALVTFTANIKPEAVAQVLVHEFSHIYFSRITGNVEIDNFRQSVPLWLDEGIALYLDGKHRSDFDRTFRKRLDILKSRDDDYFPKLMDLYTYFNRLDAEEFGGKAQKAYAFSYFCVKDLIGQFGKKRVIDFINRPGLADNFNQLFEIDFNCSLPEFNAKMTNKYGG